MAKPSGKSWRIRPKATRYALSSMRASIRPLSSTRCVCGMITCSEATTAPPSPTVARLAGNPTRLAASGISSTMATITMIPAENPMPFAIPLADRQQEDCEPCRGGRIG